MQMTEREMEVEEKMEREREEKLRALAELAETKNKLQAVERELERAKESERKMLESMIYQTKLLEQTKISLEETKLEMWSLMETNQNLENAIMSHKSSNGGFRSLGWCFKEEEEEEEIVQLREKLRSASEAEERSNKSMDDLAITLSKVSAEAKQAKERAGDSEEKLKQVLEEAALKEMVLLDRMKASEEEIYKAKQENVKLIESQRVVREENLRLRDVIKEAVMDADATKEALDASRQENSLLKAHLAEKENILQSLQLDYESLKISEAAAQDSLREMNSLLSATTNSVSSLAESVTDQQMTEQRNGRRHSIGEPAKFDGISAGVPQEKKNRMFASVSNVAELRSAAMVTTRNLEEEFTDMYGLHMGSTNDGAGSLKQYKKKKPIFRKFVDVFKRKGMDSSKAQTEHW